MPRAIDRDLRDCLERVNPYIEYRIEVSQPELAQVLRRQDQFLQAPSLVSMSPANSLSSSARGALILTSTPAPLATFAGTQSSYNLDPADASGSTRYKGLRWLLDPAFARASVLSIQAKVQTADVLAKAWEQKFECQIFQIVRTPGVKVKNVGQANYQTTNFVDYQFLPLLTPAPSVTVTPAQWVTNAIQTLNFDLSNWALILENIPTKAVVPEDTGLRPEYLIVVRLAGKMLQSGGHYSWLTDTATGHAIGQVGGFDRVFWSRANETDQWVEQVFSDVPNLTLNIESYALTGQGIFLIDLGAVPSSATLGRVEFQRSLPPGNSGGSGTNATLELSTAGSGGPWTPVKHGDVVATKQRTYHLRTTLTSDASHQVTPLVTAQGIEFRIPRDVSIEGILEPPSRELELPWSKASIPQGKLKVLRTGVRDYLDVATVLGSTSPATRLEADIFLASRHPAVTRDKWLRMERLGISTRTPGPTSEDFTLLSYASRLKRKIPQKKETLSSVHRVNSSTTTQITVDTSGVDSFGQALPGTTVSPGNEYDGQQYFIRVRAAAGNIAIGQVFVIQGNTGTNKLDFSPALPEALIAGDIIEVHSGIFQTAAVSWSDYDPADVWWELLTVHLEIPPERIGLGSLPRGGRPPKVTDIAPGDVTTQNKRRVTGRLSEEVEADKIIDIISAITGGVTLEIDGQIVYVQIYPLVDVTGQVTVPLPPPSAFFDLRDFSAPPDTAPGVENRATILSAKFGVPATAASPDAFPARATTAVDNDALLWLSQLDVDDFGTADVPDEICDWLYNTADGGLYLAGAIAATGVRALSTGLRVFGLAMTERHPGLVVGDVVVIAIDSYTDYDPATLTAIKGPIAVRGVLVRVGAEGRELGMFVPGLRDNVQLLAGGSPGTLSGLGPKPGKPAISASFDADGRLIINSSGDFSTASHKIAWAVGAAPSDATVRAAAPINLQNVIGLAVGSTYAPHTKVFIAAFAYSANGVESQIAIASVTREGSGNYQLSALWLDVFDAMNWDVINGATAIIPSSESTAGPNVLEATGYTQLKWPHKIPFYLSKLYRFRVRFKKSLNDSGGNVGVLFLGVIASDYLGNAANSNAGANYVLASGDNFVVADGWIVRDSWIRGASLAFGTAQNGSPSNPAASSPGPLNTGTVLMQPYMLLNFPSVGTPNGKYQVDFFEIVEYDEDGTNRVYVTINPDGTVIEGVQQDVAGYPRSLAKGYQSGDTVDGGVVTFTPTFQHVPVIRLSGGKAANATFPYDDFGAESSTASGFTCRAKNRNKGTTTVQVAEFTVPLNTNSAGGTVGPATLGSAPATDNNYKARFDLALSVTTTGTPPGGQIVAVVAVEVSADAGSTWTEYATLSKATSRTSAGTTNTDFPGNEITVNVAGLDPTDKIRLKLKSVTVTPGASGTATLEGYNFSPAGEGHGVVYTTSSGGGSSQSKTPDPDDFIFWEAWEKDA